MNISEIITAEPFDKIFPIDKSVLTSVIMDMREIGFDDCHPIIIWQGKKIVIDGHTRLEAARLVGLQDIPVVERPFRDEDAAVEYAIRCQRERRNLTDADIIRLVKQLDLRRQRGGDHKSEKSKASSEAIDPAGKSAEQTAAIIGTSKAKVEKVRTIQAKAAPEVKAAVEAGDMTINAAAKTTRKAKSKPKETAPIPASDVPAAKLSSARDLSNEAIILLQSISKDATDRVSCLNSVMHWCHTLMANQQGWQWLYLSASDHKKFMKWWEAHK